MGSVEILVLVAIQIAIAFFFVYWAVRLGVKHALRDDRKGQLTAQQQPPGG